ERVVPPETRGRVQGLRARERRSGFRAGGYGGEERPVPWSELRGDGVGRARRARVRVGGSSEGRGEPGVGPSPTSDVDVFTATEGSGGEHARRQRSFARRERIARHGDL